MALQYPDMLPGLVSVCQPQSSVSPATSMHEFDIVNVSLICKGIALYCFFFSLKFRYAHTNLQNTIHGVCKDLVNTTEGSGVTMQGMFWMLYHIMVCGRTCTQDTPTLQTVLIPNANM